MKYNNDMIDQVKTTDAASVTTDNDRRYTITMDTFFSNDIATTCGIPAAIVFQNLGFWVELNQKNCKDKDTDIHYHDGRFWTYMTLSQLAAKAPGITIYSLRRAVRRLVDEGLIMTGHFAANPYDRTTWYALTDRGLELWRKYESERKKRYEEDTVKKGKSDFSANGDFDYDEIERFAMTYVIRDEGDEGEGSST